MPTIDDLAKTRRIKGLGWIPDIPDARDFMYKVPAKLKAEPLPKKVDLRTTKKLSPIKDQGDLGSCTANAINACIEFVERKQGQKFIPLSRLYLYYNERVMINTVNEDSGALLRDGIKSVNQVGVCSEAIWPYDISKFAQKPPAKAERYDHFHKVLRYERLSHDLRVLKACLVEGYPFVFGFAVYSSFDNVGPNGLMPMPDLNRERVEGGHAVYGAGYDDDILFSNGRRGGFIIPNSWDTTWADKGYFYMPYDFITNYNFTRDFWTIREAT